MFLIEFKLNLQLELRLTIRRPFIVIVCICRANERISEEKNPIKYLNYSNFHLKKKGGYLYLVYFFKLHSYIDSRTPLTLEEHKTN